MKKLLFVGIAFAGLTLVSCNKDQSAVRKLDGTWSATSVKSTTAGFTVDLLDGGNNTITNTFNNCKLKTDEWCTGSTTTKLGTATSTYNRVYRVTGNGTTLEWKDHEDSTESLTMTIDKLTRTKFNSTQTIMNGPLTTTIVSSYTKQ